MATNTPNMGLALPVIGVDSGLTWEQDVNANSAILDQHNHSSGSGVQINPTGLNINSDLPFNSNNATLLRSSRWVSQSTAISGAADINCCYVVNGNLYFNDGSTNQIQITSGGAVNATASGISSGTNSASFVSNVLVVNEASNTPASIQGGSILLGNTGTSGSKYLTLSPPSALASNYGLVLPAIPGVLSFVTLDTSGNLATASGVSGTQIATGTIQGTQIASQSITSGQIQNGTITTTQIAPGTIAGTNVTTNINLPGDAVTEDGKNIVVSSANATHSLAIIRGAIKYDGTILWGEGFSTSGTGNFTITFNTAFSDNPVVCATAFGNGTGGYSQVWSGVASASSTGCVINTSSTGGVIATASIFFIAIGQR